MLPSEGTVICVIQGDHIIHEPTKRLSCTVLFIIFKICGNVFRLVQLRTLFMISIYLLVLYMNSVQLVMRSQISDRPVRQLREKSLTAQPIT
jgi:hypothetical protein